MVMAAYPPGRVLVKLSDVTQELTVGIGGANASVRTLTDISLEVRERELVVLSGSRGAGERAVLAVIAGDRRGVIGNCEICPRTRIRLLRIGAEAALALTQEWQRAETIAYFASASTVHDDADEPLDDETRQYLELLASLPELKSDSPPDLILLDVVPALRSVSVSEVREGVGASVRNSRAGAVRPWDEKNRSALLAWANVCRARGGAIVMAAGDAVGREIFDLALSHVRRDMSKGLRVPTSVREVLLDASTVRVVPMHAGRLAASVRLRPNDLAS
ncbi:MAG: hypothetical protein ABJB74_07515 [Gemmatimonas sp.]